MTQPIRFYSPVAMLQPADTRAVDRLLLDDAGRLRPVPAVELARLPHNTLRLWCHERGVYGLPTVELIDTLRRIIGSRSAIEIGAGMGVFGRALGIPMTDAKTMEIPEVRAFYEAVGQPVTRYGADVEHLNAAAAVAKYRPQVVFGSWITQYAPPEQPAPAGGGSAHGVDEVALLAQVETYLLFGNETVHGRKQLLLSPQSRVTQLLSPLFWSRSARPELNCLYIIEHRGTS